MTQTNIMENGHIIVGDYPDPTIQSTIDVQSQARDRKRESSKANFQAVVDISNLNNTYTDALALTKKYFEHEGLPIAPLRVVDRNTLQRAYNIAGQRDEGEEAGRYVNDRALIVEDKDVGELFGNDELVLGLALHEAAHSTHGDKVKLLRIVRENGLHTILGGIAITERGFDKADLRKETEYKVIGEFWEEAFADLTRVRALRALGRTHDIQGATKPFETEGGVVMRSVPNRHASGSHEDITLPAEFTMLSRSIPGKNQVVTSPPNFAAYALELLDNHAPGLYEDLKAARTNPARQRDAIQKIESVKPGLYRELRDLEYHEKDFVRGLVSVLGALKAQT